MQSAAAVTAEQRKEEEFDRMMQEICDENQYELACEMKNAAEELKATRRHYDISQRTVGEYIGWTQGQVSQFELGHMKARKALAFKEKIEFAIAQMKSRTIVRVPRRSRSAASAAF